MHDEHLNIRGLKAARKGVDCRVPDLYMRENDKRVLTWFYLWYFDMREKYMVGMG